MPAVLCIAVLRELFIRHLNSLELKSLFVNIITRLRDYLCENLCEQPPKNTLLLLLNVVAPIELLRVGLNYCVLKARIT